MKILLLGNNGWIGKMIYEKLLELKNKDSYKIEVFVTDIRAEKTEEIRKITENEKITNIVCCIGRTSGGNINTIDYLEQPGKLVENLRDNLFAPISLAMLCEQLNIHFTYFGTGCIFSYDDTHKYEDEKTGFTEEDEPNFFGSSYSITKGNTDKLMKMFKNTLNLRIRMPISRKSNKRNFITKLLNYSKICSIKNSMTVLDDFIPIIIDMITKNITGTFNMTNPGIISHNEILDLYRIYVNKDHQWENITKEEQDKILKADRSNNCLDTKKIVSLYPDIPDIKQSVMDIIKNYS